VSDWELVKARTAEVGAVWRSADGLLYKRTGGGASAEARELQALAGLGYPVPEVVEIGQDENGQDYFIERSVGEMSLHDRALADAARSSPVGPDLVDAAATISRQLLTAQVRSSLPRGSEASNAWFDRAGFTSNVFAENPDLDTRGVRQAVQHAIDRLAGIAMCRSHLDYGLPNAFDRGVIDWQHHGLAPLGYDVYPMLEIVPFKGGNRGYEFTAAQRERYLAALDRTAADLLGRTLREFLGEFLLVKCFFFLALMRPTDRTRTDKYIKWQYRRALFAQCLEQYESAGAIHPDTFPTLAEFAGQLAGNGATSSRSRLPPGSSWRDLQGDRRRTS